MSARRGRTTALIQPADRAIVKASFISVRTEPVCDHPLANAAERGVTLELRRCIAEVAAARCGEPQAAAGDSAKQRRSVVDGRDGNNPIAPRGRTTECGVTSPGRIASATCDALSVTARSSSRQSVCGRRDRRHQRAKPSPRMTAPRASSAAGGSTDASHASGVRGEPCAASAMSSGRTAGARVRRQPSRSSD